MLRATDAASNRCWGELRATDAGVRRPGHEASVPVTISRLRSCIFVQFQNCANS